MSSLISLLKNQDDSFLPSLMESTGREELLALADCWISDNRDWAKAQQLKYIDVTLTCPGHEQLFRQLFRHAEALRQHRLMGRFLVAMDRAVRRQRVIVQRQTDGIQFTEEVLRAVPNRCRLPGRPRLRQTRHPSTGNTIRQEISDRPPADGGQLFTQTTRAYFRRRIWAYFRRLSETSAMDYVSSVTDAMRLFSNEDFASGENIIDHWCLMHICFANSPVLSIGTTHTAVADGNCINDIEPAPWAEAAWKTSQARQQLVRLAAESEAGLIRWWAAILCNVPANDSVEEIDERTLLLMATRHEPAVQDLAASLIRSYLDQSETPDLLAFLTAPSAVIRATALDWAASRKADDDVIRRTCCRVTETIPPGARAGLLRLIHARRNNLVIDEAFVPFLLASLTTPGCSPLRTWILNQLLRLMSHQQETALSLAAALRKILSTARPELRRCILESLSAGSLRSPEFRSAIDTQLPEIDVSIAMV